MHQQLTQLVNVACPPALPIVVVQDVGREEIGKGQELMIGVVVVVSLW